MAMKNSLFLELPLEDLRKRLQYLKFYWDLFSRNSFGQYPICYQNDLIRK